MKVDYYLWPADLLANYVIKGHHIAILQLISEAKTSFGHLVEIYGHEYPQVYEMQNLFSFCAWKLEAHFGKEAITILPYVRRYTTELKKHRTKRKSTLYSVCPSIHKMYYEHKAEKLRFDLLLKLMRQAALPAEDSPVFETTYRKLKELKTRWHELTLLENNILFPKIIEMEAILNPM
ncbi:Nitric oxide-dependent regulator DnrN or NorA [Fulvivirga imtechensis AK7]|uniref:Nitric oxide-dependent regulator DnrN or NorA n=1 Tax=Fulvivirga imtechensis AK7 TaxID=1237149 RepID=L8JWL0_9BACT|nr:hemerythrin domain-containing protein [Fulvivirga imtechensis]ELR72004.1 Nitric oxide-dependent regulator DnrN or NorA [Fulvivirga imtechensis AK7]